jgi:hypothetical protein
MWLCGSGQYLRAEGVSTPDELSSDPLGVHLMKFDNQNRQCWVPRLLYHATIAILLPTLIVKNHKEHTNVPDLTCRR